MPGAWVLPPRVGYLWTPGWWGWDDGDYVFNPGYWGPHIGYYGGINYGFGYNGYGYYGGEWRGDRFFYNRSANNVRNIPKSTTVTSASTGTGAGPASTAAGAVFRGGLRPEQMNAARQAAPRGDPDAAAAHPGPPAVSPTQRSYNRGAPPVAATASARRLRRPGHGPGARTPAYGGGPAAADGHPPRWQPGAGAHGNGHGYGAPRPGYPAQRPDQARQYAPQGRPQMVGPDEGDRGPRQQPQFAPPAQRFQSRPAVMQPLPPAQPMRARPR